jgi:preprotein translocase subunit SecE
MSIEDLNREQKRNLRRTGAVDDKGAPTRVQRTAGPKTSRVGPAQYMREVRDEMRKVAWPTKDEIVRYSIVVIITVILYTALVSGADFLFAYMSEWLYG